MAAKKKAARKATTSKAATKPTANRLSEEGKRAISRAAIKRWKEYRAYWGLPAKPQREVERKVNHRKKRSAA
jgi:hypothetical protein